MAFTDTSVIQYRRRLRHRIRRPSDRRCSDRIIPAYVATSMFSPRNSTHPCKLQGHTLARAGQPIIRQGSSVKLRLPGRGVLGISGIDSVEGTLRNSHVLCLCATPTHSCLSHSWLVLPLVKTELGNFGVALPLHAPWREWWHFKWPLAA